MESFIRHFLNSLSKPQLKLLKDFRELPSNQAVFDGKQKNTLKKKELVKVLTHLLQPQCQQRFSHPLKPIRKPTSAYKLTSLHTPKSRMIELSEDQRKELARIMWGCNNVDHSDRDKSNPSCRSNQTWKQFPSVIELPYPFKRMRTTEELKQMEPPFCSIYPHQYGKFYAFFFNKSGKKRDIRAERKIGEKLAEKMLHLDSFPFDNNVLCRSIEMTILSRLGDPKCFRGMTVVKLLGAGSFGVSLFTKRKKKIKTKRENKKKTNRDLNFNFQAPLWHVDSNDFDFYAVKIVKDDHRGYMTAEEEYKVGLYFHNISASLGPKTTCFERLDNEKLYLIVMEALDMTIISYIRSITELSNKTEQEKQELYILIFEAVVQLIYRLKQNNLTHGDLHPENIMLRKVPLRKKGKKEKKGGSHTIQLPIVIEGKHQHIAYELVPIDFGQSALTKNVSQIDMHQFIRGLSIHFDNNEIPSSVFQLFVEMAFHWFKLTDEQNPEDALHLKLTELSDFDELDNTYDTLRKKFHYSSIVRENHKILNSSVP